MPKHDPDYAFTRCVLYFLLCDPDVKLYGSGGFSKENRIPKIGGDNCAYCNKRSFTTKKCGRCTQVKYCSKICQTRHWKSHKSRCKPEHKKVSIDCPTIGKQTEKKSSPQSSSCSLCKKSPLHLKKCTRCGKVQYCNRDCQAKD